MRTFTKFVLGFVFLLAMAHVAFAQESDQDFNKPLDQETPEQQKQEAEKPDTKASAGDLAKATQNPVASLISVPLANVTDFNIGPLIADILDPIARKSGVTPFARRMNLPSLYFGPNDVKLANFAWS
jgi:hypothetical protein